MSLLLLTYNNSSPSPPTPTPLTGMTIMSKLVPGYPAINKPLEPEVGAGSDGAYLGSVNAYVGYAFATNTIGGTPATGNTVVTTINSHAVTYTLVGGDTTTTLVATHVAAAINADSTDAAIVLATASGSVVTVTALAQGSGGQYSFSVSVTGGGVTATASGTELNFTNNLYVAKTTFAWHQRGSKTYYQGVGYQIDPVNAAAMRALGYLY